MSFERVAAHIDSLQSDMIEWQRALTAIPALGPDNGGTGEREKAEYIQGRMTGLNPHETIEFHAPDDRVPGGYRPNMAYVWKGSDPGRKIWILSHMDVVPPGEPRLWDGDPYEMRVSEGCLYGRGVEDNQHGLVSSVMAVRALRDLGLAPACDIGLVLVSDEETGSRYGLQHALKTLPDLFRKQDLIVVPDAGNEQGTLIEVAEKSMLWLRFRVVGKQCHASTPDQGVNSLRATAHLVISLGRLASRFDAQDPLFHPARSTFEPTKKEANVPNVNTIPGEDVFYLDCRVLPQIPLAEVLAEVDATCREVEAYQGVRIEVTPVMNDQAAPSTDPGSPVVLGLQKAVKAVYGRDARAGGIGGGTVAAFLRRAGLQAAVWCTSAESAHQPNEFCPIENLVGDCKVFAHLFLNP